MKYSILAEEEGFFLPWLIKKLIDENLVSEVGIISFDKSSSKSFKEIKKLMGMLGLSTFAVIGIKTVMAAFLNAFSSRCFSIEKVALRNGIRVRKFHGFKDPNLKEYLEQCEYVFTQVSKLVPKELLSLSRLVNKHASILPSYKGLYPVFWSRVYEGEYQGVTIHVMNEKFDEGEILGQSQFKDDPSLSLFQVYKKIYFETFVLLKEFAMGNTLTIDTLRELKEGYYSWPGSEQYRKYKSLGYKIGSPELDGRLQ